MRIFHRLVIPSILVLLAWYSSNINWGKGSWKHVIISDAKGYYAYLPAIFIHHDPNLDFAIDVEKKYYGGTDSTNWVDYRSYTTTGKYVDKYFCGTAFLQLPFFFTAHLSAHTFGYEADGYSKPYAVMLNVAALVYLGLGLLYLRKLLRSYQASDWLCTLIIVTIVFGTNLFYYSTVEPGMSHVYSFCAVTMFAWYVRMFVLTKGTRYFVYCSLLLALVVLIRPVNVLVLLWVPVACGSWAQLRSTLAFPIRNPKLLLVGVLPAILLLSLQLIYFKVATGSFFVYSYATEHFDFAHPEIINFLFSYRKGVFVYLPVLFLSLFGFIALWRHNKFSAISMMIFLFAVIYVFSSWWNWWYGGSFGMRVMIDMLPFFALLLLFVYRLLPKRSYKLAFSSLLMALVLLCQFQTLQYRYGVIHWSEMNKEKYWQAFLNTDFLLKKK